MIVYSTAFDAGSNTNLNAYGGPDWYLARAAVPGDIQVIASTDRVELTAGGQLDFGCGLIHAIIGSINDYMVVASVRRKTSTDMGMLGCRCGGVASSNFYMVGSDASDDLVLYRSNGSGAVAVKTTPATIPTNAVLVVTLKVSGTNPVLLTYSVGGIGDTHSDSSGSRLQTGPPGVFFSRAGGALQTEVWLDDFQVSNDLSGNDFADPWRGGADPDPDAGFEGHMLDYAAHVAYMRGGKKRKRKPHFMVESEVKEHFGGKL